MRLLVTRPEPDASRTAAALEARGHEVLLAPLLRVETIADADYGPGPFAGVLLTSANAARALESHSRREEWLSLPVLAVGRGTADAARGAGFQNVTSADGDGAALAQLAVRRLSDVDGMLLYAAGEDRAYDLGAALAAAGLMVRTVAVYRAVKATRFPNPVRFALEARRVDGVLHFSRRSAESYLDCARDFIEAALAPVQICLSPGVAEPLEAAGATQIRVATRPEEPALLSLVMPRP